MKNIILLLTAFFFTFIGFGQNAVSVPKKTSDNNPKYSKTEQAATPLQSTDPYSAYHRANVGPFNAHYLPKVDPKISTRSDIQLKVGTCLPLGEFGRKAFASNFDETNQNGAKRGISLQISYSFYITSYFGIGILAGANFFGYDKTNASNYITHLYGSPETQYTLSSSSSWRDLSFGLVLSARIPLSERLYLTGNASGRFLLLNSPKLLFDYEKPIPTDTNQNIERLKLKWDRNSGSSIVFGGGLGLMYRFTPNIAMLFNIEYLYAFVPITQSYSESLETKIKTYPSDSDLWQNTTIHSGSTLIKQNYSNLSITFGIAYSF